MLPAERGLVSTGACVCLHTPVLSSACDRVHLCTLVCVWCEGEGMRKERSAFIPVLKERPLPSPRPPSCPWPQPAGVPRERCRGRRPLPALCGFAHFPGHLPLLQAKEA